MNPIINFHEFLALAKSPELVIADTRSPKAKYDQGHLSGAIHFDLDSELAEIKDDFSIGGRHPLPKIEDFLVLLKDKGIGPSSHVIIYDDMSGAIASARLWWMLRAIGHQKVQVLDGGFQVAEKNDFSMDKVQVQPEKATEIYQTDDWLLPIASLEEMKTASNSDAYYIVDVRAAERYRGETEPLDLVAGHIPGALNIPLTLNLENGIFKSPEQLISLYGNVFQQHPTSNIIVHCGSGVTACHTILAFAQAGFEIPKLYVGSWSEWSRNDLPIATGSA